MIEVFCYKIAFQFERAKNTLFVFLKYWKYSMIFDCMIFLIVWSFLYFKNLKIIFFVFKKRWIPQNKVFNFVLLILPFFHFEVYFNLRIPFLWIIFIIIQVAFLSPLLS